MRPTLFLHMGAHRTATSSIQRFLELNRDSLSGRGILVPWGSGRHRAQMTRLFDGGVTAAALADEIEAQVRACPAGAAITSVVMSDEDVAMHRDLSPLEPLSARFEVKPIYALRRQDLWLESWFQQNVKWQWNAELAHLSFPEFLSRRDDFHWIDYDRTVRRLEAQFGTGNVTLTVFEPGRMPDGPLAAFAQAIGLSSTEGLEIPPRINGSLSPLMTEFMRALPLDTLDEPVRLAVETACAAADAELSRAVPQTAFYMDAPTRQAVLADYRDGNAALARRWFRSASLFEEPLPPEDAMLAPQTLPSGSYDTVRLIVAPVLTELARAAAAARG